MEQIADFGCEKEKSEKDKKKISYLINEWRRYRKPEVKKATVFYSKTPKRNR